MALQWLGNVVWGATDEKETLGKDVTEDWAEVTMMESGEEAELRLILVGKSGGGKSATGNTILGWREFESALAARTVTLKCQRGQGEWQDRKISVVDTPAILDADEGDEMVRDEIRACIKLSQPGPHALIFVTQVGRFTAEDAAAARRLRDIFGDESARHTIVLFTCAEDLGGSPLDEYVTRSDNWHLRELIGRCGHRFCGFNNKAAGTERERQVSELMAMVQRTVAQNGGRYYVNWLYREPDLRDEHIRMLGAQNRLADHFKYLAGISWETIGSTGRFLLSLLNYGTNADGGLPPPTTVQNPTTDPSLTVRTPNGP